jgi:GNAT superfamily N-acetyltransferase
VIGIGGAGPPSQVLFGARGEFKHLYLDPEVQGRGLGRRMMAALAGRIAGWGYDGGALGVVEGNLPALGFYARLGGREIGRYADPGPIWRSDNIALAFDDLSALARP